MDTKRAHAVCGSSHSPWPITDDEADPSEERFVSIGMGALGRVNRKAYADFQRQQHNRYSAAS